MAEKYYAVKKGMKTGIFYSWEECRANVYGYPGAVYKSFKTREEALAFLGEDPGEGLKGRNCVKIYVDGSYNRVTGEFSYGMVVLSGGREEKFNCKFNDKELAAMHNVAGEIMGALTVIEYCLEKGIPALEIHHDYEGVAKWAQGQWKANRPGTIAYAAACRKAREKLKLGFVKVKGHSGDTYNDLADRLAKQALGI